MFPLNTPGTVTLVLPSAEELPATWLAESVWAASAVPAPPKARGLRFWRFGRVARVERWKASDKSMNTSICFRCFFFLVLKETTANRFVSLAT